MVSARSDRSKGLESLFLNCDGRRVPLDAGQVQLRGSVLTLPLERPSRLFVEVEVVLQGPALHLGGDVIRLICRGVVVECRSCACGRSDADILMTELGATEAEVLQAWFSRKPLRKRPKKGAPAMLDCGKSAGAPGQFPS